MEDSIPGASGRSRLRISACSAVTPDGTELACSPCLRKSGDRSTAVHCR